LTCLTSTTTHPQWHLQIKMAGARPEGVGILAMDIYFPSTYVKQSSLETFDGVSEGVVCPPPPCGPQLNLVPVWTRHATSTQQPLHLPRPPPFRLSHHSEPPHSAHIQRLRFWRRGRSHPSRHRHHCWRIVCETGGCTAVISSPDIYPFTHCVIWGQRVESSRFSRVRVRSPLLTRVPLPHAGKYTIGLGQEAMAVCGDREDINSAALSAVQSLLGTVSGRCGRCSPPPPPTPPPPPLQHTALCGTQHALRLLDALPILFHCDTCDELRLGSHNRCILLLHSFGHRKVQHFAE
jgi:hypothetical protein